jgi:hypothetical protein
VPREVHVQAVRDAAPDAQGGLKQPLVALVTGSAIDPREAAG